MFKSPLPVTQTPHIIVLPAAVVFRMSYYARLSFFQWIAIVSCLCTLPLLVVVKSIRKSPAVTIIKCTENMKHYN